jgi:tryptophanyl-tRNA synthetase
MAELREAVGLRDLSKAPVTKSQRPEKNELLPVFKQYRDVDGSFRFKLTLGERVLLQSAAFESPKACGAYVSALKTSKKVEDASLLADGVDVSEVESALVQLIAAETARKEAKT